MTPTISIIIPLYNRQTLIRRTLDSCLRQTFTDWEAVVVDDRSTDESVRVVNSYADSRIKLVQHDRNKGQCIARNTGAAHASGEWLVFLDSDDELIEPALDVILERSRSVAPDIGRMFFACKWDDGTISPTPPFDGTRINYEGFVRWLQRMQGCPSETLSVARRTAFMMVPFPNWRTHEGGHNLDFAKKFDIVGFSDVLRLYHQDADNRISDLFRQIDALMQTSPGLARMADGVLAGHGSALQQWAPTAYHEYLQYGGLYHLLGGNRARGLRLAGRAWLTDPLNLKTSVLLACGFLPIRMLAMAKMWYSS